jgi:hypothetical protein
MLPQSQRRIVMLPYLVIAALLQLVIAVLVGGYAELKQRDGAIWFLIGLVIGPIAFMPIAFFARPASPPALPPA